RERAREHVLGWRLNAHSLQLGDDLGDAQARVVREVPDPQPGTTQLLDGFRRTGDHLVAAPHDTVEVETDARRRRHSSLARRASVSRYRSSGRIATARRRWPRAST